MSESMLKQLSPPEIKVAAKNLILSGYSSRKVAEILGIDDRTALRYAKVPTPEEMTQFDAIFKEWLVEQRQNGLALTQKRMLEIIPKYNRLDHLVKAAEYFEGKKIPLHIQQTIGEEMSITFVADTSRDAV